MTKNEKEKAEAREAAAALKKITETCRYVPATSLVPRNWDSWFWERFSENAPFTWGDNNRSLVDFESFIEHAAETFSNGEDLSIRGNRAFRRWLEKMAAYRDEAKHDPVYIDLEN